METVQLPTGRMTSRIGFGCSHLVGAIPWNASCRLLDHAFACGIRHFDVAPMYGFGEAERLLGTFLRRHAGEVTVTTKFGIIPQKKRRSFRAIRSIARPFVRRLRQNTSRSAASASIQLPTRPAVCFDVEAARKSIESSLRDLRTDYIDVLLLHEATLDDLQDDRLLQLLEAAVESGKIGTFGIGSDRDAVSAIIHLRPEYCPVVQHRQSLLDATLDTDGSFKICYGMFSTDAKSLISSIERNPARLANYSQLVSVDLSRSDLLSRLMVRGSIISEPDALWLIATSSLQRIESNCAAAHSTNDESARRLVQMIRSETVF